MKPTLQHVNPSGRGMESEHEQAAKRSAVDFIEQRIEHNEQVRRTAARKRTARNLGSIAVGLIILAGVAYYITHRTEEANGLGGLKEAAAALPEKILRTNPFTEISQKFAEGKLLAWKDAPSSVKPKNASAGTVYHALVPQTGYYALYELTATAPGKFTVVEITPFGKSVPTTIAEYDRACEGRPYFITFRGLVYVGGSSDLKAMDALRRKMLPREETN